MLQIVKIDFLLKLVAIATVAISTALYYVAHRFWFPEWTMYKVITISAIVSAMLIGCLTSVSVSRWIWAFARLFNKALFPDLNGTWEGTIETATKQELQIRATIRQSLLSTQIDMHGETVKSLTLSATPAVEQGQHRLYYVYLADPKSPERGPYKGTTTFSVRVNDNGHLELTGTYYTDRKMSGAVGLQQVGTDPSKDVSFY